MITNYCPKTDFRSKYNHFIMNFKCNVFLTYVKYHQLYFKANYVYKFENENFHFIESH